MFAGLTGATIAVALATASVAFAAAPTPAMEFVGRGAQIYHCEPHGAAFDWVLKGPNALLYDAKGRVVARHFFGPRWQANDGSEIRGVLIQSDPAPEIASHNAPWLVLHAIIEGHAGLFAHVTTITRTDTRGGGVPAVACDAAIQGTSMAVPYSATYTFFSEVAMGG